MTPAAAPRSASTLTRASALIGQGRLAEARTLLERALAGAPDWIQALDLLTDLCIRQGDWPAAKQGLARQLVRRQGPEADYARSHLALMFGDFSEGWPLFESRLLIPGRPLPRRDFPQPRWDGGDFSGRTLLVNWEQGFGDTLMFLRFLPLVKARGGRVLLSVQGPLAGLAATCAGADQVVAHEDPLPGFDLHVPLLSLPGLLGTGLETIPADIPYLDLPAVVPNRSRIAAALAGSRGRTRVGLVWAGNRRHPRDRQRSLAPEELAPLAALPGVAWHSLQLESDRLPPLPGLLDLGPLLSDFADTAYALSGMDLVICVDTAIAHLAGALGIPTLLLLPFVPDWRWLLGRSDSPWYPTMLLLRQRDPDDWRPVIADLLAELGGAR